MYFMVVIETLPDGVTKYKHFIYSGQDLLWLNNNDYFQKSTNKILAMTQTLSKSNK